MEASARGLSGPFGAWVLIVLGVLVGGGCGPTAGESAPEASRMRVSAAASLGPVLEQLRPRLEADLGVRLELNLAGSGTLTRQVREGAPADAVLLAYPAWVDTLVEAGRVAADDRVDLLSNTLVVVGRGERIALHALDDPARFRRIAWGDPASVPAGRYAQQALRAAGVWDALDGRGITTVDVRAALAYAVAGEVDAAIVYASDAVDLDGTGLTVLHRIDPATHDPVVIVAGAVGESETGRLVVEWLRGESAGAAFAAAGFGVVENSRGNGTLRVTR